MEEKEELIKRTEQLKKYNNEALDAYTNIAQVPDYSPDFFTEVKPFADKVKECADQWKPLAEQWVVDDKPTYFYLKQIEDTHENILISSVTAFQSDTKEKRFREMIQSIDYILSGIEKEIDVNQ
ncbi:YppE family protein [Salibacterium salarium]|nr:YppE family protein [Salibacterium salarium]